MAWSASRVVWFLIALLLGGFGGWFLRPRFAPVPTCGKGTSAVLVGPSAATVVPECLKLSKRNGDQAYWTGTSAGKHLFIEFTAEIFEGMSRQSNGRWRVSCTASTCSSGRIKPTTAEGTYKYWQILVDPSSPSTADEADGRIIIQY